jgi:hypothetical protein
MVVRTRLSITLYVHCLYFLICYGSSVFFMGVNHGLLHREKKIAWGCLRVGAEEYIWAKDGRDDRGVEKATWRGGL